MCPCLRHRQKGRWSDAVQGNWSIASGWEKLPFDYSASHPPVHRPLITAGKAEAECCAGLDTAGFNGKEKSRGGGNISRKIPRRAEHARKPRTALLFSKLEFQKSEGCRSVTIPFGGSG